jgi:phosphatidylserine/phosphatidylglycerophosphate/cardiolipin synthase-like enzyme
MASTIPKVQTIIGSEFPKKVIPLIDQAKRSIEIIVFDWRWYPQNPGSTVQLFNQSLVRAARRKVKIRAIANNNEIISTLTNVGIDAKKIISKKLVHSKLMIIDNRILIIGSHNYTQSAFQMNMETSLIIENDSTVERFLRFFNNLF